MSDRNSNLRETDSQQKEVKIMNVESSLRWQIFHRLKALEIFCQCGSYKPLLVEIDSPQTAIQVWSVVKQIEASRQESIAWLERCWQMK